MKDRKTGKVKAKVMKKINKSTILKVINKHIDKNSTLVSDEDTFYNGVSNYVVKHRHGEYVNGIASTNGIESFWSMLKRGYIGTHHWFSEKHMNKYVNEYCARQNLRQQDTIEQMNTIIQNMVGKRLKYKELIV